MGSTMFFANCLAVLLCLAEAPPPDGSLAVAARDAEESVLNTRSFMIPIHVQEDRRADIARINLFVSRDKGKKWVQVASVAPDAFSFNCQAPDDGLFWFSVQIVTKNDKKEPPTIQDAPIGLKVRIATGEEVNTARPDPIAEEIKQTREQIKKLQQRLDELEKAQRLNSRP
jgi:hypothetical protein